MKKLLSLLLLILLTGFVSAEERNVGPPTLELKFPEITQLESFINNYKETITTEVMQQYEEAKEEGGIYNQWSLELTGEVTYKGRFWNLMVRGYDYRGGAHGMPYLDALYFDSESKEPLEQSALFVDGSYEKLSELCRAELISQGFEPDDDWMLRGTEPTADNYRLIVFTGEGVEVLFNAYQVAPYAAGVPAVQLAWSELDPLLKAEYRREILLEK